MSEIVLWACTAFGIVTGIVFAVSFAGVFIGALAGFFIGTVLIALGEK